MEKNNFDFDNDDKSSDKSDDTKCALSQDESLSDSKEQNDTDETKIKDKDAAENDSNLCNKEAEGCCDTREKEEEPESGQNNETSDDSVKDDKSPDMSETEEPDKQYAFRWDYLSQEEHDIKAKRSEGKKGALRYGIVMASVFAVCFAILIVFILIGNKSTTTVIYESGAEMEALAAEKILPSTVIVHTESSVGSGFIIREDGYIVTNCHVIKSGIEGEEISVVLYGGQVEYRAKIIGYSENDDLAVIKINRKGLIPAVIGNSDEDVLRVGEHVIAVGNPAGPQYSFTVTEGIISSTRRSLDIYDINNIFERSINVIQTSAPVNPGNSGGPLVNAKGEVIGVVSMKSASGYEGLGFALPINESMVVIEELIRHGNADGIDSPLSEGRVVLGIQGVSVVKDNWYTPMENGIRRITEEEAKNDPAAFQAAKTGVLVSEVTKGLGCEGLIKKGDIVTHINEERIDGIVTVSILLKGKKPGDTVKLTVFRDGKTMDFKIVLAKA